MCNITFPITYKILEKKKERKWKFKNIQLGSLRVESKFEMG